MDVTADGTIKKKKLSEHKDRTIKTTQTEA